MEPKEESTIEKTQETKSEAPKVEPQKEAEKKPVAKSEIKKDEKKEEKKDLLHREFKINLFKRKGGVSQLKLAFAIRNLSIMLRSGLALEGAMTILSEQLDDNRLREIFGEILVDNKNGISISESMRKHPEVFSNLVISLVSSGEQGATLESNLLILADYLKKDHEMKQKVKGAMVYPFIVLGITMIELLGVVYFLLPKLDTMFAGFGDLPEFTMFVMNAAKFLREHTLEIVVILVVFIIFLGRFLKTKPGKRIKDTLSLNFPVIKKLTKNNTLATFSQTFSILLQNGIPIIKAIKIASETTDNSIYSKALEDVRNKMEGGMGLSESMTKYQNLFPMTYIKMIEIGEQTGSLPDTLTYIYEFYAEEAAEISNNLATLLEPILLVFIGVMIGGLAIIIIGPIYQLMGGINA
jgi:type IV pilus assembly protein PilC